MAIVGGSATTTGDRQRLPRLALALVLAVGAAGAACAADFYADAVRGDDVTGDGSLARPWRTITRTLAGRNDVSAGPDDVWVAAGTYDAALGEIFPLRHGTSLYPLSIHGAPGGGTRLVTDGSAAVFIAKGFFSDCGVLEDLAIDGHTASGRAPAHGIDFQTGGAEDCLSLRFRRCQIIGFGVGYFESRTFIHSSWSPATPSVTEISGCDFRDNDVGTYSRLEINRQFFPDFSYRLELTNNVFARNGTAVQFGIVSVHSANAFVLEAWHNTIVESAADGIHFEGLAGEAQVRLENNLIAWNGGYGVDDRDPWAPVYESNLFWQDLGGDRRVGRNPGHRELFQDPLLTDRAGGDYRPTASSPCVDAGSANRAITGDIAGTARPLDGDGDQLALPDVGAYEAPGATAVAVALRRARFDRIPTPDLPLAFPMTAANPRTPAILPDFLPGDLEPTARIVTDPSFPLVLYGLDPMPNRQLLAVKSGETIRFELE